MVGEGAEYLSGWVRWDREIGRCVGTAPGVRTKCSSKDLLEDLERVCDELGRAATVAEYRSRGRFSYEAAIDRFGSWCGALDAAGYEPAPHQRGRSDIWGTHNRLLDTDPEDVGLSPIGERA